MDNKFELSGLGNRGVLLYIYIYIYNFVRRGEGVTYTATVVRMTVRGLS